MFKRIYLQQFKNFKDANLGLGAFTLLVGMNASGKSNIRDAFRFLHGISKGYSVAEIIDKKTKDSVFEWRGVRGGIQEVTFASSRSFQLGLLFSLEENTDNRLLFYQIEIEADKSGEIPRVISEHLSDYGLLQSSEVLPIPAPDKSSFVFDFYSEENSLLQNNVKKLRFSVQEKNGCDPGFSFSDQMPILSQFIEQPNIQASFRETARLLVNKLGSMRFLDLSPDVMRIPSLPGQMMLGDRGENLSSVLQAICKNSDRKQALLRWIRELTLMNVQNLEFSSNSVGKILFTGLTQLSQ
jgi:hypothetical protein